MLVRYSFEPRPKGRVLVTLGSVMTIDQSINGCSYSEKKKTVWRESTRLTSPEVWAAVGVLKGLTRSMAERSFHLLTHEEAKGSLLAGCVVFIGNKKVKS